MTIKSRLLTTIKTAVVAGSICSCANMAASQETLQNGPLRAALLEQTQKYLKLRQNALYDLAWAMMRDQTRAKLPLPEYIKLQQSMKARMGGLDEFQVLRTIKYDGGMYAIDYAASYDKGVYECAYLIWHGDAQDLKLGRSQREQVKYADLATDKGAELLRTLTCKVHSRKMLSPAYRAGYVTE
jgi:hypothetical protein